ncbi:MAG: 2-oxo acid dehydrogenase subunit E2 [Acidobacteriota bacterium]|nr:2-oxo acid dehydrogenase subunit E2 [Acidobacteriota bacterium]
MGDFTMPSLGADMDAGTVTEWLVTPGDEVHRGDIVAVVETEKSTIDVEIFESGRIEEILVPVGTRVAVGTALARVTPLTAPAPAPGPGPGGTAVASAPAAVAATVAAHDRTPPAVAHHGTVLSPVLRRLAEKLGVEIAALEGSGPGGVVTRADVERAARPAPPPPPPAPAPAMAGPAAVSSPQGSRVPASPLARRVAADAGLDLVSLAPGSGPAGAVVEADVRRALEGHAPAPVPAEAPASPPARGAGEDGSSKQAAMRRAIGTLMARSKREIPHYYLSTTIDMERAAGWLAQANEERPLASRLVMPVLLLKATALAVAGVPEMNGFMVGETFEPSPAVHVGVAVSMRGGGVIAPAIHDVPGLSLDDLMAELHDLVNRARHGSLRSSEMSDPTITVTNLGDLGVESVFGVIYPPQVALVGFGRVQERPWAHEGMVGGRQVVTATLSADHRVSDGHRGGLFLSAVDKLLQRPEEL